MCLFCFVCVCAWARTACLHVRACMCVCARGQFYRYFRAFLSCSVPQRGSSYKPSRTMHTGRRGNNNNHHHHHHHSPGPARSPAPPTRPSLDPDTSERANQAPACQVASQGSTGTVARPKVHLVAYYRE